MTKREKIFDIYGGKCAYTGKPLDSNWQIDHVTPKITLGKTLQKLYVDLNMPAWKAYWEYQALPLKKQDVDKTLELAMAKNKEWNLFYTKNFNDINNLVPSLKIINHYKRDKDLESFRKLIAGLQSRIDKMPVWLKEVYKSNALGLYPYMQKHRYGIKKRFDYLKEVAGLFGITKETPFNGKFYFESLY